MTSNDLDDCKQKVDALEKELGEKRHSHVQLYLAYATGVGFLSILLYLAIYVSNPTMWQYTLFRTIMAIGAAGVAAILAGDLELRYKNFLRATGAMAVFVLVYKINPAALVGIQEPLHIVPHPPKSVSADAHGVLLDIDPVKVERDATGANESVSVYLENVETNARTIKKTVLSDVRETIFKPENVRLVASNREYHGKNIIRAVIEWPGYMVRSESVDLFVGIKVRIMIGFKSISNGKASLLNKMLATIDDSTLNMPRNYCFSVDFGGHSKDHSVLVAPIKSCNSAADVELPFLPKIDWASPAGLVFNEPRVDRLLVRSCIEGGSDLRPSDC